MESQTRDFGGQDFSGVQNGLGEANQLVERAFVQLTTLEVAAQCDVPVRFPFNLQNLTCLHLS